MEYDQYDVDSITIEEALQEILDSKPSAELISDLLNSLMGSVRNDVDVIADFKRVASLLHQIYCSTSLSMIRAMVLDFCYTIDANVEHPIVEEYMFDFLIARSLCSKQSPQLKIERIKGLHGKFSYTDYEKQICFTYIDFLLHDKPSGPKKVPVSIIRALIYLYQSNYSQHTIFKHDVAIFLFEIALSLTKSEMYLIPDILDFLLSYLLIDKETLVPNVFSLAIEYNLPLVQDGLPLLQMLRPITNFTLLVSNDDAVMRVKNSVSIDNTNQDSASISALEKQKETLQREMPLLFQSVVHILGTWPGLLYFGIKNKAIEFLMNCLSHRPNDIIGIFKTLVKLNNNTRSVLDGYNGFLFSELLKLNVIEILSKDNLNINPKSTQNSMKTDFLNEILPYTSHFYSGIRQENEKEFNKDSKLDCLNTLIDYSQLISHRSNAMNPKDLLKNFEKVKSDKKILNLINTNWTQIHIILTVVLLYNPKQSQSKEAINLYSSLINFMCHSDFENTTTYGKSTWMLEPISALFNLLFNTEVGKNLIKSELTIQMENLKKKFSYIISKISEDTEPLHTKSPEWFLFKLLMQMMSLPHGKSLIDTWPDFKSNLLTLGLKVKNELNAKTILKELLFVPVEELALDFYDGFLSAKNAIHALAISHLRKLRETANFDYLEICFRKILMKHIYNIRNHEQKLAKALNLLGEIISTDENALKLVCEDINLISIIYQSSHFIFSILLSREETGNTWKNKMNELDEELRRNVISDFNTLVDSEIQWWMTQGNEDYVTVFDLAFRSMLSDKIDMKSMKDPSIFIINGCCQMPPHLFGHLTKTNAGLAKLDPFIKALVSNLSALLENDDNFVTNTAFDNRKYQSSQNLEQKENHRRSILLPSKNSKVFSPSNSPSSKRHSVKYQRSHSLNPCAESKVDFSQFQSEIRESNILKVRATLFALAHVGSNENCNEKVQMYRIIDTMILASVKIPSYEVKGTLLSVMPLFTESLYLSDVMRRHKWQHFKFGQRSCVIPKNANALFDDNQDIIAYVDDEGPLSMPTTRLIGSQHEKLYQSHQPTKPSRALDPEKRRACIFEEGVQSDLSKLVPPDLVDSGSEVRIPPLLELDDKEKQIRSSSSLGDSKEKKNFDTNPLSSPRLRTHRTRDNTTNSLSLPKDAISQTPNSKSRKTPRKNLEKYMSFGSASQFQGLSSSSNGSILDEDEIEDKRNEHLPFFTLAQRGLKVNVKSTNSTPIHGFPKEDLQIIPLTPTSTKRDDADIPELIDDNAANILKSIIFAENPLNVKTNTQTSPWAVSKQLRKSSQELLSTASQDTSVEFVDPSTIEFTAMLLDKIGKQNINSALAVWANQLIAAFSVNNFAREVIYEIFKDVPLIRVHSEPNKISNKQVITACYNEIYLNRKGKHEPHSFDEFKPKFYPLEFVRQRALPFPESCFNDSDFENITKMTRGDFYNLSDLEKEKIRHMILTNA